METTTRIPDLSDVMEMIAEAGSAEERKKLRKISQEADGLREDYGLIDTSVLHSGHVKPGEITRRLDQMPAEEAAQAVTGGNLPDPDRGALQVDCLQIYGDGRVEKNDEMSGPRWCLGGFYREETERDVRPLTLRLCAPPKGSGGLPQEEIQERIEDEDTPHHVPLVDKEPGDELEMLQRRILTGMFVAICRHGPDELEPSQLLRRGRQYAAPGNEMEEMEIEDLDRVPVKAKAEMRGVWKVTTMDAQEIMRFTDDAGDWHYLGGLLSDGGSIPGTNDPDYVKQPVQTMSARQATPLYEMLGMGPAYDFEAEEPIIDGQGLEIWPKWPTELGYPEHRALDAQIRCATGYLPREQPTYTKGMKRPIKPSVAHEALEWYDQLPEGDERRTYFQGAAKILRDALGRSEPTILLIMEDQVKVGASRSAEHRYSLTAHTYLRGTFEADTQGRPRAPFRIIGNPQLTQFLNSEGWHLLEDHVQKEMERIARMTRSLPGIAELAGDTTAHRREEILSGESAYETGKDLLTDAITGGMVRLESSDDWISVLEGERSGRMCMPQSVKQRLLRTTTSYIKRRVLRGQGIYGYGGFNMTCADDQYLLQHLWGLEEPGGKEYAEERKAGKPGQSPLADPSGLSIPAKIAGLLGADDDGDIVTGLAADMTVPGPNGPEEGKAIMIWRYPCVDVPAFFLMPKGTPTPFDARNEDEAERFERVLDIYGLELQEGEPDIEAPDITLLTATNATRLADEGARDELNAESISLPASEENAWKMVQRKRKLNATGRLTRDLERIGQIMSMLEDKMDEYPQNRDVWENEWKNIIDEATDCRLSIEIQLIQHKKWLNKSTVEPDLVVPGLQDLPNSSRAIRQSVFPIDYPEDLDNITTLLKSQKREDEPADAICLEEWEGPGGRTRTAQMLRDLVTGEHMDMVIEAMEDISTDREPHVQALEKRVRDARNAVKESEGGESVQEFDDRIEAERNAGRALCELFRAKWSEELDRLQELKDNAEDPEAAAKKVREEKAEIGQALSRFMNAMSSMFTPEGLANAVYWDWRRRQRRTSRPVADRIDADDVPVREWQASTKAGMSLLSGRIGECLLPPALDVEVMHQNERYAVVYSTRDKGDIPGSRTGETTALTKARVDNEGDRPKVYVEYENGSKQALFVDQESALPPQEIAGAMRAGNIQTRVSKIAPKRGILRWTVPQ